jgi:hypothetical protein
MMHLSSGAVAPFLIAVLALPSGGVLATAMPVFERMGSPGKVETPGWQAFAVAVPLNGDELLVIRERQVEGAGSFNAEAFIAARRMKARYEVRITEAAFAVRVETSAGAWRFAETVVRSVRHTGGVLRVELADVRTGQPRGALVWSARVESMESFARRHPSFRPPEDRRWFLSWYTLGRYLLPREP